MKTSETNRFSRTLQASQRKIDNHPKSRAAKIELRYAVIAAIGRHNAAVFDAFAGAGGMYRAVWRKAKSYVGCDTRWFQDERLAYVADNRRVLRAIDLAPFNIFDLDAYGSPWDAAAIIAHRRTLAPGERLGLMLTEGSGLNLKLSGMPGALAMMAGIDGPVAGAFRNQGELIDMAINGFCRRIKARVAKRWQAEGHTGASVRYIGLLLEGVE